MKLEPERPWAVPAFDGSMLRGAFGHALKRLVCVMRLRPCEGCPLARVCMYMRIFETPPDPDAGVMRRYTRAPHPMVLLANLRERRSEGAEPIVFGLRLFGAGVESAPYAMRAVEEMATRGLTRERVPFALTAIAAGESSAPPGRYPEPAVRDRPAQLPPLRRWRLRTPLRISREGRPLDAERLDGPALGRAVLRRVGLMASFYGEGRPNDFEVIAAEADRVRIVECDLAWRKIQRHSSRQRARQAIGGLVGEMVVDFTESPRLAQLADWVPVVHLGKGTSMGLGRIEAEAA